MSNKAPDLSTTRSGMEEWIPWRGSVSDLVTDVVCALSDDQLDAFIERLQNVDRPRKRRDSGMYTI